MLSDKVKAAVIVRPGEIEIREFPYPKVPDDAALIKMEYTGICGTDKHIYKGESELATAATNYPIITGHEDVGVIAEIGPKAAERMEIEGNKLEVGDRIAPACDVRCEECNNCRRFYGYNFCENVPWVDGTRRMVNYGTNTGCADPPHLFGAMAEYQYLIPQVRVAKVPEGVTPELASLTEILAVVISAYNDAGPVVFDPMGSWPGATIVVQGPGPMGALSALYARVLGAGQIIMTGSGSPRDQKRLEIIKGFEGVDHIVNDSTPEDRITMVKELTDGKGADLVVEFAGVSEAVPEGIEMAKDRGATYLLLGLFVDMGPIKMNPFKIAYKQMRVVARWSWWYQSFPTALRILQRYSDSIPFGKVITHKFDLEDTERAYQTALSNPTALKVLVGRGST